MWVKWVLTNAKTVLAFVITLKSAKKSREWEGPKERGREGTERPAPSLRSWVAESGRAAGHTAVRAVSLDLVLLETQA